MAEERLHELLTLAKQEKIEEIQRRYTLNKLAEIIKKYGVMVDNHDTSYPCSSRYSEWLEDDNGDKIVFIKKKVVFEDVSERLLNPGSDKSRDVIYIATDDKGRKYLVYEWENGGWSVDTTWYNKTMWVVPLQPMKVRVVERGMRVRCGPDGSAWPYGPEVVAEREFRL